MRNENGQFIKGHTGNPLGRPKRADEQILVDLWDSTGRAQFADAIERGEPWALKSLMDKLYANRKSISSETEATSKRISFSWDSSFVDISQSHKEELLELLN